MAATIKFHGSVRQRPRSSLQFSKPYGCAREQEPHEACPLEPQLPAGATPIPVQLAQSDSVGGLTDCYALIGDHDFGAAEPAPFSPSPGAVSALAGNGG